MRKLNSTQGYVVFSQPSATSKDSFSVQLDPTLQPIQVPDDFMVYPSLKELSERYPDFNPKLHRVAHVIVQVLATDVRVIT